MGNTEEPFVWRNPGVQIFPARQILDPIRQFGRNRWRLIDPGNEPTVDLRGLGKSVTMKQCESGEGATLEQKFPTLQFFH
jgi:hypothetical protein